MTLTKKASAFLIFLNFSIIIYNIVFIGETEQTTAPLKNSF